MYYGPAMRNPLKQQKKAEGKYLRPPRIPSKVFAENSIRDSPLRADFANKFTESQTQISQQSDAQTPLEFGKAKTSMGNLPPKQKTNSP